MREYHACSICGRKYAEEELTLFAGDFFCENCLDEETVVCADCGERIWADQNSGNSGHPLCQRCFDRHYTNCERCGAVISNDEAYYLEDGDDYPYCESCYHILQNQVIHNYDYHPEPHFYGTGQRFFGVELEIDKGGEIGSNAEKILAVGNRNEEYFYCKHDGSLDDGFEIVSHPATAEYHLTQLPWKEVMAEAVSLGYRSHQACTCGLHIHISRDSFGDTEAAQDAAIGRLLFFVEKHWNELLKFSRRTNRQLERWAARYGYKDTPQEMMDQAKNYHYGRYTCVNLTNSNTVEIRIFRGTLKYTTLAATIQLTNRLCSLVTALTDEELRSLSWSEFIASVREPELIQYLKERRLYLNEPVESEVEL